MRDGETRHIYMLMLLTSVVFVALCFAQSLDFWHGAVLLGLMVAVLWDNLKSARVARNGDQPIDLEALEDCASPLRSTLWIVGGIVALRIGTSLPELATSVMPALRRQADVSLGNVIGSNVFNIALIMGVTSFFGPVEIAPNFLRIDL